MTQKKTDPRTRNKDINTQTTDKATAPQNSRSKESRPKKSKSKNSRPKKSKPKDNKLQNTKPRDSSAKTIFGNHVLCAQFLRGYTDIDLLKDVQPEDIEDITEHFPWLWQEHRDSDSVKRIRLRDVPGVDTLFVIALIEHQSSVDYDMSFRMLPKDEVAEFTDHIERRDFSMLLDHFEAYDVQATRAKARAEGRAEGLAEGLALSIIDFLEDLGTVSDNIRDRITQEPDLDILKKWNKAAARADSVAQFVKDNLN